MKTGLTDAELHAMDLTAQLAAALGDVVCMGRTRDQDLTELVYHLHAIQHAVMGQAAARAHPRQFRLLGETLVESARRAE